MVGFAAKKDRLWDASAPRGGWQEREARLLAAAYRRCPVLTLAGALFLSGAGLLLAVSAEAALVILPLSWLLGWL